MALASLPISDLESSVFYSSISDLILSPTRFITIKPPSIISRLISLYIARLTDLNFDLRVVLVSST